MDCAGIVVCIPLDLSVANDVVQNLWKGAAVLAGMILLLALLAGAALLPFSRRSVSLSEGLRSSAPRLLLAVAGVGTSLWIATMLAAGANWLSQLVLSLADTEIDGLLGKGLAIGVGISSAAALGGGFLSVVLPKVGLPIAFLGGAGAAVATASFLALLALSLFRLLFFNLLVVLAPIVFALSVFPQGHGLPWTWLRHTAITAFQAPAAALGLALMARFSPALDGMLERITDNPFTAFGLQLFTISLVFGGAVMLIGAYEVVLGRAGSFLTGAVAAHVGMLREIEHQVRAFSHAPWAVLTRTGHMAYAALHPETMGIQPPPRDGSHPLIYVARQVGARGKAAALAARNEGGTGRGVPRVRSS